MLKFGGGKALTKQTPDEAALKCPLTIEEAGKVIEDNALVICDAQDSPKLESKLAVTTIRTEIELRSNGLGKIMPELYDLEDCAESEKPLKIDLNLYQMEKV